MTDQATPTSAPAPAQPAPTSNVTSLDGWKKSKNHTITLPSGSKVIIQIPDLPALVKNGTIPNSLIDIAVGVAGGKEIKRDDIEKQAEFYDQLVAIAVVEPTLSIADAADIPFEDKEMIIEIATRQRDIDVLGHHLAGLEKVKEFRTFRGLGPVDEDVA